MSIRDLASSESYTQNVKPKSGSQPGHHIAKKFDGKIFFYIHPQSLQPGGFLHLLICIAEGLQDLGVEFYSNLNYWQKTPDNDDYLFRHQPTITPDDCDVVVLSNDWCSSSLPDNLFTLNKKCLTVYLDAEDSDSTYFSRSQIKKFDLIFRTHYNCKLEYWSNVYPWNYGCRNKVLKELGELPKFNSRKHHMLVNFRYSGKGHSVRSYACNRLLPLVQNILPTYNYIDNLDNPPTGDYDYFEWQRTGRRYYPNYYNRLKNSTACAAFGGFFVTSWPKNPASRINRGVKRILTKFNLKSNTIVQWDSWRFWESLAAGCVTFHLDFEKYGLCLPVMPQNWQHYIGIDLDNIEATVDRLVKEPEILEKISIQGRDWALLHYSPIAVASRFLEKIYPMLK